MLGTDALKKGALILGVLLVIIIGFYAALMIGGLIVGSISNTAIGTWNGTTGSGSVTLSTGMKNAVLGYTGSYITDVTSLQANATLIIGLIAIVVIILVFGFKFNFGGGKGKGSVD